MPFKVSVEIKIASTVGKPPCRLYRVLPLVGHGLNRWRVGAGIGQPLTKPAVEG